MGFQTAPPKKQIIIGILCIVALGLACWFGLSERIPPTVFNRKLEAALLSKNLGGLFRAK